MLLKEAKLLVRPSNGNTKMNCGCWGIPTSTCDKHFVDSPSSTCNPKNCYAKRNQYNFPNVKKCQAQRLEATQVSGWTMALITILRRHEWFRFFDSGDFPDPDTMRRIMRACGQAPDCKVYIPTKKYHLVHNYRVLHGDVPDNVCLRPGIWLIDPTDMAIDNMVSTYGRTSFVTKRPEEKRYHDGVEIPVCHARKDGVECIKDCQICWDNAVKVVAYPWH